MPSNKQDTRIIYFQSSLKNIKKGIIIHPVLPK